MRPKFKEIKENSKNNKIQEIKNLLLEFNLNQEKFSKEEREQIIDLLKII